MDKLDRYSRVGSRAGLEIEGDVNFLSLSLPRSVAESMNDIAVVILRLSEVAKFPQEGRTE